MNIDEFVNNFAEQFDETDPSQISSETNFRDIEEWSSFNALSIIAMVDEAYGVKITGDDIIKSNTVQDIFNLVIERSK